MTNEQLEPHVLPLVIWPDPRLHVEIQAINTFDTDLKQLVLNLFATMKANDGIGLAAPQVNQPKSLFVINVPQINGSSVIGPLALINPIIKWQSSDRFVWDEGCLSVPGYFSERERPNKIFIEYQNPWGGKQKSEFDSLEAFVVQHEYDHLCQKVFVDGLSKFKEDRIKQKIKKHLRKNPTLTL